jgi:hypothetical protein
MADAFQFPSGCQEFHQEFKKRDQTFSVWASMAVRQKLTLRDWSTTGRDIAKSFRRKERDGKIEDRLTKDFQIEFTRVEGFSPRNFCYMRSLAEASLEPEILKQLIAKLPSGHNVWVLDHIEDRPTREWNLQAIIAKILQP